MPSKKITILIAIALGFLCAAARRCKVPVLSQLSGAYIELFRNTPLLVQLFFLYFGLPKLGFSIQAEDCGVLGLALHGGAYMAETFRSGLEAVDTIQTESALSLGMSRFQTMRYVVLPQAVSISVPAFTANVIFLLKETSVFSAISLMDLMFTAKDLIGLYYRTVECLVLLVIFYLLILLPVSALGSVMNLHPHAVHSASRSPDPMEMVSSAAVPLASFKPPLERRLAVRTRAVHEPSIRRLFAFGIPFRGFIPQPGSGSMSGMSLLPDARETGNH